MCLVHEDGNCIGSAWGGADVATYGCHAELDLIGFSHCM